MKEPAFILLDDYSRNSDIYQAFYEEGNFYSSTGEKFELTETIFQSVLNSLQEQINDCLLYIDTARELRNTEIQEVVERKEYMKELEATRTYVSFLYSLLKNKEYSDIEGIYCNID